MIADYLNQTAVWKKVNGTNEYGEPVTTEQTIKVRWEGKRRLVRDTQGQQVVSEATVYCLEDVKPGDIMIWDGRDWSVIAVSEFPDLYGRISHREVAV